VRCHCRNILFKKDPMDRASFTVGGNENFIRLEEIPEGCKSLVVTAQDHSGKTLFWIVYNIPVHNKIAFHEPGGRFAINDFMRHSLVIPDIDEKNTTLNITVYALDTILHAGGGKHGQEILKIMHNSILTQASDTCTIQAAQDVNEGHAVNDCIPLGMHD
jgi:phosphatidylethanolamine-binding protein (PEBP) family uncharacterized protein